VADRAGFVRTVLRHGAVAVPVELRQPQAGPVRVGDEALAGLHARIIVAAVGVVEDPARGRQGVEVGIARAPDDARVGLLAEAVVVGVEIIELAGAIADVVSGLDGALALPDRSGVVALAAGDRTAVAVAAHRIRAKAAVALGGHATAAAQRSKGLLLLALAERVAEVGVLAVRVGSAAGLAGRRTADISVAGLDLDPAVAGAVADGVPDVRGVVAEGRAAADALAGEATGALAVALGRAGSLHRVDARVRKVNVRAAVGDATIHVGDGHRHALHRRVGAHGYGGAGAELTRDVAGLAQTGAGGLAAHLVDAVAARALGRRAAGVALLLGDPLVLDAQVVRDVSRRAAGGEERGASDDRER